MKNIFRCVCVLGYVLGIIIFSFAYTQTPTDDVEPAVPFVATYIQSRIAPDGNSTLISWRHRYVKANGDWRIVSHPFMDKSSPQEAFNAEIAPVLAGNADAILEKPANSNVIQKLSPSIPVEQTEVFRSHKSLQSHREFNRIEELAGLKVYVLRQEITDESNQMQWVETSYSPKTGFSPLRTVIHLRDGSEIRIEAIKVDFREVTENLDEIGKTASENKNQ